jgi:hypothetical protein
MNPVEEQLSKYDEAHRDLHRQWTEAVGTPGYCKTDFQTRDNSLAARFKLMVQAMGYHGPLIRW